MSKREKTQIKLSGKIGCCPEHLSEVKRGIAHLGANAARKAAKVMNTDTLIWINGATKQDIEKRAEAINNWCS